jgi:hypothetical protein
VLGWKVYTEGVLEKGETNWGTVHRWTGDTEGILKVFLKKVK